KSAPSPREAEKVPVHSEEPEALIARCSADPNAGLTSAEAAKRLTRDGANELPQPPGPNRWKQFFTQFANPIVLTLLAAAVIAVINGATSHETSFLVRFGDATAIGLIVIL